jgi:expansin (peptidoglycan-binding protein)
VTAEATEDASSTSTSTDFTTTTITVHPSGVAAVSTAPLYSNSSVGSNKPSYPTLTFTPTQPAYSNAYTPIPLSEAAEPTSEAEKTADAASQTSAYEASAESSTAPVVDAGVETTAASNKGDATFYGGNVAGGMCSFTGYTIPSGLFGTALSDSNWSGGANCGACVSVTGPSGNKITAMVVDQCPGCGSNHLDLFPDAFAKLAYPSKGVIPVSWDIVPCGIKTPIVLKNKSGTSKYWFSMQVMNSNVPVSKLEVSTDGGNSWKSTTRKDYNFFENPSGFGTDSVDVKVTSTSGSSIIVKGVSIAASSTKTAASNFS